MNENWIESVLISTNASPPRMHKYPTPILFLRIVVNSKNDSEIWKKKISVGL